MSFTRRNALRLLGAGLAALGWPRSGTRAQQILSPPPQVSGNGPARAARMAFLTDCHLPASGQTERFIRCLRQLQSEPDPPEFVVFGGDNVFAVDGKGSREAAAQFGHWQDVLASELRLPWHSVIGNHDICHYKDKFGKAHAIAAYGMPGRYYSFTRCGWRFVMLDSFQPGAVCGLDKQQYSWLSKELEASGEHVCLVSHAPVISAAVLIDKRSRKSGRLAVPSDRLLGNALELRELFRQHPQVRLALSGHIHHVDRVDYDAVTYLGGGAVSGSWWNGSYCGFAPAYVMLDLYDDGSLRHEVCFWEQAL